MAVAKKRKGHASQAKSPGPTRELRRPEHVGPNWKVEDWRSFKKLRTEAFLLEPDPNPIGVLGGYQRPSRFTRLADAVEVLSKNPVYCSLVKNVPLAVDATHKA